MEQSVAQNLTVNQTNEVAAKIQDVWHRCYERRLSFCKLLK